MKRLLWRQILFLFLIGFFCIAFAIVGATQFLLKEETKMTATSCDHVEAQERIQCFDRTFDQHLQEKGADEAFEYLLHIYTTYPEVPVVCHEWMHRLGEANYEIYKERGDTVLPEEASYCSYGYFHGFIGAMAYERGLQAGEEFCEQVAQSENRQEQLQFNNCIHGIGHTVATLMLESNESWGDAQKIIVHGVHACEGLYENAQYLHICYDGMFHEFRTAVLNGDYGLTGDEYRASGDLFYYCRDLPSLPLQACVYDFISLWPDMFGTDKKKAMDYVLHTLANLDESAQKPIKNLGRSFIEEDIQTHTYSGSVEACEIAEGKLYRTCLEGLATGFVEHGIQGKQHEQGFVFCREYYEGDKQKMCFEAMIEALSWSYTEGEMDKACTSLGEGERPLSCS